MRLCGALQRTLASIRELAKGCAALPCVEKQVYSCNSVVDMHAKAFICKIPLRVVLCLVFQCVVLASSRYMAYDRDAMMMANVSTRVTAWVHLAIQQS